MSENGCVVRQSASGNGNLGEGRFVVAIAVIGDPCCSQMRLTTVGAEA